MPETTTTVATQRDAPHTAVRVDPVTAVALGHVLTHAYDVGLPMPDAVHLLGAPGQCVVRLDLVSVADLAEWALYLDEPIESEALTPHVDHHSVAGEILELALRVVCTVSYDPSVPGALGTSSTGPTS